MLAVAKQHRIPIHMISFGGAADTAELRMIASETGGQYLLNPNAGQLAALYQTIAWGRVGGNDGRVARLVAASGAGCGRGTSFAAGLGARRSATLSGSGRRHRGRRGGRSRITSYNVCYTKLLRFINFPLLRTMASCVRRNMADML